MKFFILFTALLTLNSCNTIIGMYRDTKQGVIWTKGKIDNARNNSGGGSYNPETGAAVY